jgi:hypothetical protein
LKNGKSRDHRSRARLDHRKTFRAERTNVGLVGRQVHLKEHLKRDVEARATGAAIHDRRDPHDPATGGGRHLHRLTRRAARREDILDDQDAILFREHEPASQHERAILPFREDSAHAERACDFMADDDATKSRREDDGRAPFENLGDKLAAERLGMDRMLQDERALEIARAVQPGRQAKVPLEQGALPAKDI